MKVTSNSGAMSVDDDISEVKFDIMIDDDDDILIQAEDDSFGEEAEEENETEVDLAGINFDEEMEDDEAANISVGVVSNIHGGDHDSGGSGFDVSTGNLWIYPTNYPVRDYQYNIVQQALYKNTLVVLPTGLGKTFIAAVLMYNFFRWFPQGKIVFMAPTKPLVAQQIQACYNIMGIPKADTVEMTGTMPPSIRQKAWREKRVVFLTPQVMTNDLSRGSVTAESIKCLVLDEAHKALGNHAYCQVVRELIKFTREFRVLALSATPGSDLKAVQQVMNNLLISHIELRSEESIDIRAYTHERKVDKIVIPLGEELSGLRLKYIQVMTCVVQRLIRNRVLYNREATKLSKFLLLKARDEFRQNPPQNLQKVQYGNIEADFAMAMSVYHGFELLQLHGLRSLHNYLTGIIVGEKGYGRTRSELLRNADFNDIMENLRQKFTGTNAQGVPSEPGDSKVIVGHPKMQRLEEIVVDHFKTFEKKEEATRVMIFSQYRDSVQEIATILNQHQPLIKVMPFIGQSSAGKTTKGYTQKEQLMVMRKFREGGYNTLVSTCVGEEGLDIGDVDLIVCFDAHKSPIRLVQRMGRTGRKRQGRIVMLVTEGKEEQIYNQSLYSKKTIHKAILNGAKSLHFYPDNRRMLPSSVTPQCHKMHITLATESKKTTKTPSKKKGSVSSKNQTLSDVFGKQAKKVFQDECLTAEEYAEIKTEFAKLPSMGKQLSKPRCVMLESHTQDDFMETDNSHMIDFSEWMPWQNRLQSTHMIGHSVQTVNLVKTSEFIELQRFIGDDEDHYGLEMSRLLKENDVESGKQSNMHSFFTKSQNKSESCQKDKLHPGGKKSNKSKSGCTEHAAVNTSTDTILVGSDSSVDGGLETSSATEHLKPKVSKLFTELGHCDDTSNIHTPKDIKKRSSRRKKAGSNKTLKLDTKSVVQKKPVKKKKHSGNNQNLTTNKRKISFLKLLGTTSCNIPTTKDSEDFEADCLRNKRTSWLDMDNDERVTCLNSGACEDNVAVKDSVTLNAQMEVDVDIDRAEDPECQDFVPCAIESCDGKIQKQESPGCHASSKETFADSLDKVGYCISKPPPISGVKELFQSLNSGKEFRELDLEELMKQWDELGREVCSKTTSQQKIFMSAETRPRLTFVTTNQTIGDKFTHEIDLSCAYDLHEEACAKQNESNQAIPQKSVDKMFVTETKQSVTSTNSAGYKSADDLVAENTPVSPLFKRLVNKTVQINTHKENRLPNFSKKMFTPEKEQADFCRTDPKDSWCGDSFLRNCAQKTRISQHVVSSKEMMNTDISAEENRDILMKSFMDGEKMDVNSCGNTPVSPVNLHESFVTFTQAMECLQTSSEETAEVLSSSPPRRNSSRITVYQEHSRSGMNTPSRDNKQPKIEFAENIHKNLGSCNQYSELTAQDSNHCDKAVPHTVSSVNSSTELSVNACTVSVHDSLVLNLQSESGSNGIMLKSNNWSLSDVLTKTPETGCNKLELPQFDLGFDFDDDIIPPTPTKNQSQESVFGLKYFTLDKHSLQESRTLSLSDTDKAPVSVKRLNSDVPVASPSASALSGGTGDFEPFMSTFDLQLSSDDSQDMPREVCEQELAENLFPLSEAESRKQREEKLSTNNQPELGVEKCHQNKTVSLSESEKGFRALPLIVESGNTKTISLKPSVPSPPKKKRLPFNEYASVSEKESNITMGGMISPPEGRTFSSGTSPRHSMKFKAERLRLGKRHVQEIINDNSVNAVVTDYPGDQWQKDESLETSTEAVFKSLIDLDEVDNYENNICQNTSFDQMQKMSTSLSSNSCNPVPVSKMSGASAAQSHNQESPKGCEKPGHHVVKASTPIRDAAEGYHVRHSVIDGAKDIDMSQLTPIRAKKDESKCDSGDGFVVRRKKRITVLDISSDQDAMEDTTSVSTEGFSKGRMLTLKQTEACKMKQVNKSLLESISDGFDDDNMDDFQDSRRVIVESEQNTKKTRIQKKTKMSCYESCSESNFCSDSEKKPKARVGAVFIEKEAEVSGDDMSSDEQEDMDDFYESSFIDNNTAMTQTQSTDMRAIYLKSIKSPMLAKPASYCRMQYNPKRKQDSIFSQTLPEDEGLSEYEEDSFCVGSDEEDIIYAEEESELPDHTQKHLRKAKTRQPQKGKKRIQMISDTSSDEERDSHIQLTQEFSIHPCKFGRKVLLSSSEDEGGKVANVSSCHLKSPCTGNLEKSGKNIPNVKFITDTVIERQNLTKTTDAFLKKNMEHVKFNRSSQQMSNRHPDASDVGNFDLLGEADWSDVSETDSVNRNASAGTFIKGKCETEKGKTGSKFLSLKDATYVSDHMSKVTPLHIETAGCSSKNDNGIRLQGDNSVEYCASSLFTNVANKPSCDNTKHLVKWNANVANKPSCDNTREFAKYSECDNRMKYPTGQSPKGNNLTSLSFPSSSQTASDVASCISRVRLPGDVDMLETSPVNVNSVKPPAVMTREERLRRQKEKQEMYRKKLQQVQQIKSSSRSLVTNTLAPSELIPETNSVTDNVDNPTQPDVGDFSSHGQISPVFTKLLEVKRTGHQLQILVDSREISGSQDIISALRLKHCITVTVRQLSCCDYILSNCLAADRVQWSSFSNSSYRSKLSSRLCEMQAMYERCVLIVEADKVKAGQEKSRKSVVSQLLPAPGFPLHRTKYLDTTLSYLIQSKIKVYFTDSAEETAALMADLCHVEDKKGRTISVPAVLSSAKEEMFSFVLSVPKVTVPQALNLTHKFRSVNELLSSPPGVIQERGCMTMDSARALHQFLRHQFNIQMMPSSKS